MKKHSCIKEFEIPKQAYDYDSYNGFTYSYILVEDTPSPTEKDKVHPKGKMYHGAHGSDDEDVNANIDDSYHQSCRDKDFRLLYSSGKPVFKLVINELFTNWSEAKNAEHIFLKKERTKNPEMFFNNHNGFSTHKLIDRDKVHKLVNEIKKRENNKFGWNLEDKKNHEETNISSFQVRYEEDKKHELDVMHLLNDNEGVTDITKNKNIDPVVICENRGVCGRDVRIDGNITTAAILHKKSLAEKVPTIRIPEEVHKEYTDDELRHAALMLNKREQKIKKPTNIDDAIKFIYGYSQKGKYAYNTKENKKLISEDYNLNSHQTEKVMDGVKDWIYEEEQRKINQVYKDYTTEEKNDFVIKLKKDHKNTIIGWISAGMSDKIPAKILDMVADDIEQAKLDDRDPFKKIILAVHFSKSKALRDEWRKKDGIWDSLSTKFANLNSSYQLDYEEFPLTVSDTK